MFVLYNGSRLCVRQGKEGTKVQIKNKFDMKAENIRIGMKLNHRDKGEITVLGISPHCGDYCITIDGGWVYLKNCTLINSVCKCKEPDINSGDTLGNMDCGKCGKSIAN